MSKSIKDILSQPSGQRDSGFKVPDNYFEEFNQKMIESLPNRVIPQEPKRTLWQYIRPWAYMAAMFGGIWCMMYLFTSLSDSASKPSMAEALGNEQFLDEFMLSGSFNEYELMEQMYEDSTSVDFEYLTGDVETTNFE